MKYILGDCGRSYVVGFGNNPPTHVHHRGASCPLETGGLGSNSPTCDFSDFNLATSNPNILFGALVGGARLPATTMLVLLMASQLSLTFLLHHMTPKKYVQQGDLLFQMPFTLL